MITLAPGARLGRYEIRSKLGEGGMGEVYRAFDPSIQREVAIKVLPAGLVADAARLRRFEQEACAAGALNHPNILVIHHVDTHDGAPYIVSELLEGDTLRQRMGGAALAQRRVIDYAIQMANGLAAAHEKGIVHRDLKPENIFITKDGRVKILDFGIAKLTQADGQQSPAEMPTGRVDTDSGVVLGTVGYMSPEQVRGRAVDARADIFSFGVILYEMLSGRRAFQGESAAETMSAILREDPPDLAATNQQISPGLQRLVHRCLEKNPEARFHSASDLAFALDALAGSSAGSGQTTAMPALAPRWTQRRELIAWIVAAGAVAGAILVWTASRQRAPLDVQAVRFPLAAPNRSTFGAVSISPDGHRLAYVATDSSGKRRLWIRPLDSLTAQPLPDTDGATGLFWDADSRAIAFFVDGKLKKIDAAGGAPPQTIATTQNNVGGTWNRNGVIVFTPGVDSGLYRVSQAGGEATPLTTLDTPKENSHRWPQFLPDGRHFLYFSRRTDQSGIYVGSLDSAETKHIVDTDFNAMYAPPGYLLFVRESALMAQPFDTSKLELEGDAVTVVAQIGLNQASRAARFSVSANGVLVYSAGDQVMNSQLTWYDRAGKPISTVGPPGSYASIWLSPDEKRVAVERLDKGSGDIFLFDGDNQQRFTFDPAWDLAPIWLGDGRIVFGSVRNNVPPNLYVKPVDFTSDEKVLLDTKHAKIPTDWSSDGNFILYRELNSKSKFDLWTLPLGADLTAKPFLQDDFDKGGGKFSPDGKWVAYYSDESGQYQVYVQQFPERGRKKQISASGGSNPRWRSDGKELYYLRDDGKLMAVEVRTGATFEMVATKPLFDTHLRSSGLLGINARENYAVTKDGQRFLMNDSIELSATPPITVVLNWTADVRK